MFELPSRRHGNLFVAHGKLRKNRVVQIGGSDKVILKPERERHLGGGLIHRDDPLRRPVIRQRRAAVAARPRLNKRGSFGYAAGACSAPNVDRPAFARITSPAGALLRSFPCPRRDEFGDHIARSVTTFARADVTYILRETILQFPKTDGFYIPM